jgi:hypothetical protein
MSVWQNMKGFFGRHEWLYTANTIGGDAVFRQCTNTECELAQQRVHTQAGVVWQDLPDPPTAY